MWYLNDKPVKNPVKYESEDGVEYVFVPVAEFSNPDNDFLPQAGCVWVEPPAPPTPIKKYSRYKIYCKLSEIGQWDPIISSLEENKELYWQFMLAEYLKEDNPAFIAFLQHLPEELKQYLDDCLWDEE